MNKASRDPITAVSFHATVPKFGDNGLFMRHEIQKVEFKLGLGPCKETVEFLSVSHSIGWVNICQRTECGTKDFHYRVQDIIGRVVVARSKDPH